MQQIEDIEVLLPLLLRGLDCDNGSEILTYHLLSHFTKTKRPVRVTRSRAYHENDNSHVEQKNWPPVRQWLGYHRFAIPEIVPLLNELHPSEWRLFHNFFCPSVKLLEKQRVASKTIKRYDTPKTPYQRIMDSPHIPTAAKRTLSEQLETLNPLHLRTAMEVKLKKIFQMCYRNSR